MKKVQAEQPWWEVPFRATVQGTTLVQAATAEEARALVESGTFDLDPGAEMVDWGATGPAKESR